MIGDTYTSLRTQKEDALQNLLLIEERKAEYVLSTDIPLDLIRQERKLRQTLNELEQRLNALLEVESPYRGLKPFRTQEHAAYFFGREAMTLQLIQTVAKKSVVAVVGRSGSGKSSLVFGGLLTQLQHNALPDSANWRVATCQPGADPIGALALALQEQLEPAATAKIEQLKRARELADQLSLPAATKGITLANDLIPALKRQYPDSKVFLLVVDQFEELLTAPINDELRTTFVRLLLDMTATHWVKIVITLRTDYYDALFRNPQLTKEAEQFNVYPMTADELRNAIVKPADATGRTFEEGLVSRILDDIANSPGDLALLEFTLTRLWEYQTADGLFTHTAYEEIGEVSGAIAKHADEVIDRLDDEQKQNARRLFQRLVRFQPEEVNLDAAARVTVPLSDLSSAARTLAVDTLAYERLVVTGRREYGNDTSNPSLPDDLGTVELVHDALIRHWKRLQEWLREDAQWLAIRQGLTAQVELWERYGEDSGLLYEGRRLDASLRVVNERPEEFSERELHFLKKSQERQRLRTLSLRGGYGIALVALAIVGWILWGPKPASVTDTPIPMPASNFNIAVAKFLIADDATPEEQTDLDRHAEAVAEDVKSFFVANADTLQAQFNTGISILTPDRIELREEIPGQLLVSSPELTATHPISYVRANIFVYGYIRKGQGRQWKLEPRFSLSSGQSTLNRAQELLGEYALGEPIVFVPSSFTSERVQIRSSLEARLRTLLVMLQGLDAYDQGTEIGYQQAEGIFCPVLADSNLQEQYESIDLLYLFCGHALSSLLDIQEREIKRPEDAEREQKVINTYAAGLEKNPANLRLRASFASQLIRRNQPDPECQQGNTQELERAKAVLGSIIADADSGAFLPLPTRMEVTFMQGVVHFWTGHCSTDMEKKLADFDSTQNYLNDVLDIRSSSTVRVDIADFIAGKAYSYLGYLFLVLYSKYNPDPSYVALSADEYDASLQLFRGLLPDNIAYEYADQILPNALMALCLAQRPEQAQEYLDWFVVNSPNSPDVTRETILERVPLNHQEKEECGL